MKNLIEQAKDIYEKLGQEIERLESKPGTRKPECGEEYWFIDYMGEKISEVWANDIVDDSVYKQGNVFPTREAAERECDRRALLQELKEFADFVPDWGDGSWKYELFYNFYETEWDVSGSVRAYIPQAIYFKTEQRAQEAIKHFGDRLDLLLPEGEK